MRSFGGGWGSAPGPEPGPAPEDADAYAQRLWEEMQQRQRATSGAPSAAAQATWGAADAAARARDGRRGVISRVMAYELGFSGIRIRQSSNRCTSNQVVLFKVEPKVHQQSGLLAELLHVC